MAQIGSRRPVFHKQGAFRNPGEILITARLLKEHTMKEPGPDHPITISPNPRRVRVEVAGHVIANSAKALSLKEATYPAVQYLPRQDVEMGFFAKTAHSTHCPYKGEASYFTVSIDGVVIEDVAWSYEDPYPAMQQIDDHVAFYTDKVRVYEVDAAV